MKSFPVDSGFSSGSSFIPVKMRRSHAEALKVQSGFCPDLLFSLDGFSLSCESPDSQFNMETSAF